MYILSFLKNIYLFASLVASLVGGYRHCTPDFILFSFQTFMILRRNLDACLSGFDVDVCSPKIRDSPLNI